MQGLPIAILSDFIPSASKKKGLPLGRAASVDSGTAYDKVNATLTHTNSAMPLSFVDSIWPSPKQLRLWLRLFLRCCYGHNWRSNLRESRVCWFGHGLWQGECNFKSPVGKTRYELTYYFSSSNTKQKLRLDPDSGSQFTQPISRRVNLSSVRQWVEIAHKIMHLLMHLIERIHTKLLTTVCGLHGAVSILYVCTWIAWKLHPCQKAVIIQSSSYIQVHEIFV